MILKLVNERIANKNGQFEVTAEFIQFLNQSLNKDLIPKTEQKTKEQLDEIIQRKNQFFLNLFNESI